MILILFIKKIDAMRVEKIAKQQLKVINKEEKNNPKWYFIFHIDDGKSSERAASNRAQSISIIKRNY